MSSMVMAEAAVVAPSSIEAIMEVYARTIIPIRAGVITRIIIARIHDTSSQQHDKYQKEKFFHLAPPLDAFLVL